MDLSRLRAALQDKKRGDVDLSASFKQSALAITQFLKTAQLGQEKAYQQGYADALSDVLGVIHAGLDMPTGKGISQVIDWIDARQEALAADSSEADEAEDEVQTTPQPLPAPKPILQAEIPTASTSRTTTPIIPPSSPPAPASFTFSYPLPVQSTSTAVDQETDSNTLFNHPSDPSEVLESDPPPPLTSTRRHKPRKHPHRSRLLNNNNSINSIERERERDGDDTSTVGGSGNGRKRNWSEDDPMAIFEAEIRPNKRIFRR